MIRRGVRRVMQLALRRRDRWEVEVEDEIKLHLALRAEQLAARGLDSDDAYREAVRKFGPLTQSRARLIKAASRRERTMQQVEFLGDLRQDVAFALRTLARQKTWTIVTVLTLALGVGATTSVFSVVSTLLIHRLPYPDGDRVVVVRHQPASGNNTGVSVSIIPMPSTIEAWQRDVHAFEAVEATLISPRPMKMAAGDDGSAWTAAITTGMFDFAGVRAIRGRVFTRDETANGARVALLGEGFWRTRLGADSSVLGKQITLADTAYTVIGVMGADFRVTAPGRAATDVWLPMNLHDENLRVSDVIGRLRPGATTLVAQREMDSVFARVGGFTDGKIPFKAVAVHPSENVTFRDSLLLLTAAVGLLLLVACTNVAHLLLARTATRQREIAIRTALGAASGRLFRQLLTESAILCGAGTIVGLGLGWIGVKALIALRPANEIDLVATHVDRTTLAVALGVTVLSAILFGVIGVIEARRHATNETLKGGSIATTSSRGHRRLRGALVVSEIALSVMLVVGAGLVIRSLQRLQRADLGFDTTNLYAITPPIRPNDDAANARLRSETFARVRSLPGVVAASISQAPPGFSAFRIGRLEIDGEPALPDDATSFIAVNHVQPNYFETMRIALIEGATFADTTDASAVIVNEAFARKRWPRGTAVGKRLRIAQKGGEPWLRIVGVAREALTNGPTAVSGAPLFYLARTHAGPGAILVRTTGGATPFASILKAPLEHGVRPASVLAVADYISQSIDEPRFVMFVMTSFGLVALLLASVGLYGVMSYTVAQESRDIGVRVALGAPRGHVMRGVLVRGTTLALSGVVLGLVGATWGTTLVENHLFGMERLDAASFAGAAVVLVAAALIACIVPTRRALAVDPITAIRAD